MNDFLKKLQLAINEEFAGNQRALGRSSDIHHSLISRILDQQREPTPATVGRLAGAFSKKTRDALIKSYLHGIAEQVAAGSEAAITK